MCLPQVLYQDCRMVAVTAPYVAGFLAFREVPVLVEAVQRLQQEEPQLQPQVGCVFLVLAAGSWERISLWSWLGGRGTVRAVVEPLFPFLRELGAARPPCGVCRALTVTLLLLWGQEEPYREN